MCAGRKQFRVLSAAPEESFAMYFIPNSFATVITLFCSAANSGLCPKSGNTALLFSIVACAILSARNNGHTFAVIL